MNIALDIDGTYSEDPDMWDKCVRTMRAAGHKVYVVTMRYPDSHESKEVEDQLTGKVDGFFFTSRKAKGPFMRDIAKVKINIWIDDTPFWITMDAG